MTAIVTAIGNRKGGVGKTSVTLGLAMGFSLLGRRVLVIDLDPQANATTALEAEGEFDIFDVLYGGEAGTLGQAIVPTSWAGIDAVPGSGALSRIESEVLMTPELRLKTAAWNAAELDAYDHILLDLPPALGRLTLNGLIWATRTLIVTEPTAFAVKGVTEFMETVRKVKSLPHLNPDLEFAGILINKTSSPLTGEHSFQIGEMEAEYGSDVVTPYIPHRTAMQDSVSSRSPLTKLSGQGAVALTEKFVEHARRLDGASK
ncbi:chromosome partitioning protein (plasmid) [Arthrobacter sp. ERGS1:01]|uniref:ParA family protein n=1 Tax=Arthrobacter sp. ERGS1:01 TaxID=1704044 RepID=UPI0006B45F02|nr:ParA family protein [Arthrobacter sp. ERGS1:01]ALE04798.1 chromosome partitioning protein [Arthrobacter sp. ERGS1:01]